MQELVGDNFTAFLKIVEITSKGCQFLTIKDNVIRQIGSSKRNIFECDLTPILGDKKLNIIIPFLEQKYQLLDAFQKKESKLFIEETETQYLMYNRDSISDDFDSVIHMPKILKSHVDKENPFLDEEEFNKRVGIIEPIQVISKKDNLEINKNTLSLIRSCAVALSSQLLNVLIEEDSVILETSMADNKSPTTVEIAKFEAQSSVRGRASFRLPPILSCPTPMKLEINIFSNKKFASMLLESTIIETNEETNQKELKFNLWNMSELELEED